MDSLPLEFTAKRRTYRQLKRTAKAALYEVSKPTWKSCGYEVFRIKVAKAYTWPNGTTTPEHEAYPGDEAFGKSAWYYMTLHGAEVRFKEIA